MSLPTLSDLIETFALLPDWEARYAYLIDLGRAVPAMDPALKVDEVLVPGCTSRVWLVVEREEREKVCHPGNRKAVIRDLPPSHVMKVPARGPAALGRDDTPCRFHIDSDAAIVKGLCAVLMVMVDGKTGDQIRDLDVPLIFGQLNLGTHLSPNRRNGFFAMVDRIQKMIA